MVNDNEHAKQRFYLETGSGNYGNDRREMSDDGKRTNTH